MTIVARSQWGARPPRERTRMGAAAGVARHYEGVDLGPYDHASCAGRVRSIQNYHMDRNGWSDIAYSFIVCRHGYVYEGRWANVRTAANGTNAGNARYYAGCILMGPDDELTTEALAGWLEGRAALRKLTGCGPETPPHSALFSTACPGGKFRDANLDDGMPIMVRPNDPPAPVPINDYTVEAIVASMPTVREGAFGQHVKILQGLLTANGEPTAVDGAFGTGTARALRTWQGKAGLTADAICGPLTWRRLLCV